MTGTALLIKPSAFLRYGVSVVAVALALGVKLLLDPLIVQDTPFLLVFAAIMISAWYGGLGPGLLATVLAGLITDYFFLYPKVSFSGLSLEATPLVVFALEGFLVSFLTSTLHSTRERAQASAKVARAHAQERKQTEQKLKDAFDRLLALYETGHMVSTSLKREEIGSRLLESMRHVCEFSAAFLELRDDRDRWRTLCAIGPESLRSRASAAPEAQAARHAALEAEEPRSFGLCDSLTNEVLLWGLCLPLRIRERLVGILEVYGASALAQQETVEVLESAAGQAASALENARLYEELSERERQLHDLVGRILLAQEEERRRVAYEVHDGPTQAMVAAYQRLQFFAEDHPPGSAEGEEQLGETLALIRGGIGESRRVIAGLRPTVLDDLGLAAAIRQQAQALGSEGWQVSYEETLGDERLPDAMEVALFYVAQEALTNARKHAGVPRVHIKLERLDKAVRLQVRDWGRGFRADETVREGGPGERVGISSMRERVSLLGGDFEIRSEPGAGTSVVAEIPLPTRKEHTDHES